MKFGLENVAGDALEKYPYTLRDFKADNPNISPPNDLLALGAYRIVQVAERGQKPDASDPATLKVEPAPPVKVAGTWTEQWVEVAKTAEEQARYQAQLKNSAAMADLEADAFWQTFVEMTPAQVTQHVEDSVTDLASAKLTLKRLAKIAHTTARMVLR